MPRRLGFWARTLLSIMILGLLPFKPSVADTLCVAPTDYGMISHVECSQTPVHRYAGWLGFSEGSADHCQDCPFSDSGVLCATHDGIWTISSSAEDPFQNVGPLPADGFLYLWLVTNFTPQYDVAAVELGFSGTLSIVSFDSLVEGAVLPVPAPPESPNLLIGFLDGCETPPILVGRLTVERPSPVESLSWGRVKAIYE